MVRQTTVTDTLPCSFRLQIQLLGATLNTVLLCSAFGFSMYAWLAGNALNLVSMLHLNSRAKHKKKGSGATRWPNGCPVVERRAHWLCIANPSLSPRNWGRDKQSAPAPSWLMWSLASTALSRIGNEEYTCTQARKNSFFTSRARPWEYLCAPTVSNLVGGHWVSFSCLSRQGSCTSGLRTATCTVAFAN